MKKPNIVLFVAEDLDFEGVNCYDPAATGYSGLIQARNRYASEYFQPVRSMLTPTIDYLSGDGAQFTNYYCAAPVCTPSRYTIMTGRFPERSREFVEKNQGAPATIWFNTPVCPGETLLPKALKDAGYETAIFGKWHNYPSEAGQELRRLYYGFPEDSTWADPAAREAVAAGQKFACEYLTRPEFGWDVAERIYYDNPEPYLPTELSSHNIDWVAEGAVNYLRGRAQSDKPFFAYVAVSIPHSRYSGRRFAEANPLSSAGGLLEEPPRVMASREQIRARVRAAGLPDSACEGLWLDEAVKAVYQAACAAAPEEETLFIFTTDHPTGGKGSVHLGRIPLIFHWPGRISPMPPQNCLLSEADLAPTILELAGCPVPAEMAQDGRSFAGLLLGNASAGRDSILMELVNSRAVVARGFKYIANRLPDDGEKTRKDWQSVGWLAQNPTNKESVWWHLDDCFPCYFDGDELYDLEADPLEQHNLAGRPEYRSILSGLQEELRRQLAALPHPFGEFR